MVTRVGADLTFSSHEMTFPHVTESQLLEPGFQAGMWWCTSVILSIQGAEVKGAHEVAWATSRKPGMAGWPVGK